jgi:hypothetical protein
MKMSLLVLWVATPCEPVGRLDTTVSEEHTVSIFSPEDGDSMFLRNFGIYLQVHTVLQPTRPTLTLNQFSYSRVELLRHK